MAIGLIDGLVWAVGGVLLGAVVWSKFGGVKPERAVELAKQAGTFILDVRTEAEFAGGHLERAKLIPVQSLAGRSSELPSDKKTPILVYCAVGGRSAVAAGLLKAKGYEQVHDMSGGISAWQGAGFPVVK